MLRALILLACALILPLSAAGAEKLRLKGIKGNDDRQLERTQQFPWSAIGRVNKRTGGFCTGTLIGARTVLTAAHCFWNQRTRRWLHPKSLHFLAAYSQGRYLAHSRVKSYRLSDPALADLGAVQRDRTKDWAVMELVDPVGEAVGHLPLLPLAGTDIAQAGYSQDKPHMLTIHEACRVTGRRGREVVHDCDATHGDSGSPILGRDGNRVGVVAIHVATAWNASKAFGIAITLPEGFDTALSGPTEREGPK